jgi:chemotaxis protein MotB
MARRQRKKPPEDNELRWLTTYGDVVTLLLAFFVMLYAISQVDQQKFQLFVTGLADPFGNPALANGVLADGTGIVGAAFADQEIGEEGMMGVALLDGLPQVETESDEYGDAEPNKGGESRTLETTEDLLEVREAVVAALSASGLGEVVDFEVDMRGLTIAIAADDVLFASGSSDFGERGRGIISAIAPTLAEFDNEVLVEGHTDNVPINRAGYDNWNLSADRALAVLRLLIGDHDIAPDRVAATGYGEYRPKRSNDTEEGKAINRRVDLVIVAERGE